MPSVIFECVFLQCREDSKERGGKCFAKEDSDGTAAHLTQRGEINWREGREIKNCDFDY